jgi:hypothetical protein
MFDMYMMDSQEMCIPLLFALTEKHYSVVVGALVHAAWQTKSRRQSNF